MVFVTGTQSHGEVINISWTSTMRQKAKHLFLSFLLLCDMSVYMPCMWYVWRGEESQTWRQWSITWFGYWKPNLWSLGRQQVLLTTKPSFHPQERFHSFLLVKLYKSLGNYCYVSSRWGPGRLRNSCTVKIIQIRFSPISKPKHCLHLEKSNFLLIHTHIKNQ